MGNSAADYARGHADGLAGASSDSTASAQYQEGYEAGLKLLAARRDLAREATTAGIPAGGAQGKVLAKASASDFDMEWAAGGGGGGGIDFDQTNEGTSLEVTATSVSTLKLNDTDDNWDVSISTDVNGPGNGVLVDDPGAGGVYVQSPNSIYLYSNTDEALPGSDGRIHLEANAGDPAQSNGRVQIDGELVALDGSSVQLKVESEPVLEATLVGGRERILIEGMNTDLQLGASKISFFDGSLQSKPTVTGSTADDKINSLITALASLGLITDSTS